MPPSDRTERVCFMFKLIRNFVTVAFLSGGIAIAFGTTACSSDVNSSGKIAAGGAGGGSAGASGTAGAAGGAAGGQGGGAAGSGGGAAGAGDGEAGTAGGGTGAGGASGAGGA
jgi:hypothetical protein